jgi:hypothetical protein
MWCAYSSNVYLRLSDSLFIWSKYNPHMLNLYVAFAGQAGAVPERRTFQGQVPPQGMAWPGTGHAMYMQHPAYMQAVAGAAAQNPPHLTYPAYQPGTLAW